MGQFAVITSKDKSTETLKKLNKKLKAIGFTQSAFVTESDIKKWYKNVLNSEEENCKIIRETYIDKKGNFTLESYKEMLSILYEESGLCAFDYAFGRTTNEQLNKAAKFIFDNVSEIESVKDLSYIIERGNVSKEIAEAIRHLEHIQPEPGKLPEKEQYKPTVQSGNLLCKSFSPSPFWVIFGKVDEPKFMTERVYVDPFMNKLHRDKEGRGFMLIPLMTLDDKKFGTKTQDEFFKNAWNMGLREHPDYFFSVVYNLAFPKCDAKNNENGDLISDSLLKGVANEFLAHYTPEELWERFLHIQTQKQA